jgi:phage tail-like protein
MPAQDLAASVFFAVSVDNVDLGWFTSVEGLGCEIELQAFEEGGNNGFVWQLPTRIKYTNIKLSRPADTSMGKIADWFAGMARGIKPTTATVEARDADNRPIMSWEFNGVVPVRWTGPSFSADSGKAATETIELAHRGFTVR